MQVPAKVSFRVLHEMETSDQSLLTVLLLTVLVPKKKKYSCLSYDLGIVSPFILKEQIYASIGLAPGTCHYDQDVSSPIK